MSVNPSMIPVSVGSWYNPHKGAGQPSADLGGVGDTYLDTTNNVYYVKTNSGWMDTKGSSTLPSPTGVAGKGLVSAGSSWTTSFRQEYKYSVAASIDGKWCCAKIFSDATTGRRTHVSFDFDISANHVRGGYGHVDIVIQRTGSTATAFSEVHYDGFTFNTSGNIGKPEVKMKHAGNDVYFSWLVAGTTSGQYLSIYNFITTNTGVTFNYSNEGTVNDASTISGITDFELSRGYIIPAVSTASNQVLVSDGNGGWSATAGKPVPVSTSADAGKSLVVKADGSTEFSNKWNIDEGVGPIVSAQTWFQNSNSTASNDHNYVCMELCSVEEPVSSNSRFHIDGFISMGCYDNAMVRGVFDLTGTWNSPTTQYSPNEKRTAMVITIPYGGPSNTAQSPITDIWTLITSVEAVFVDIPNSNKKRLCLIFDLARNKSKCAVTISSLYHDESLTDFAVGKQTVTVKSVWDDSWVYGTTHYVTKCLMGVPTPTAADAGKVLKVNSSGVPEWTTA